MYHFFTSKKQYRAYNHSSLEIEPTSGASLYGICSSRYLYTYINALIERAHVKMYMEKNCEPNTCNIGEKSLKYKKKHNDNQTKINVNKLRSITMTEISKFSRFLLLTNYTNDVEM